MDVGVDGLAGSLPRPARVLTSPGTVNRMKAGVSPYFSLRYRAKLVEDPVCARECGSDLLALVRSVGFGGHADAMTPRTPAVRTVTPVKDMQLRGRIGHVLDDSSSVTQVTPDEIDAETRDWAPQAPPTPPTVADNTENAEHEFEERSSRRMVADRYSALPPPYDRPTSDPATG